MAPEIVLRGGEDNNDDSPPIGHTKAVDWWSVGVLLWEFVAGAKGGVLFSCCLAGERKLTRGNSNHVEDQAKARFPAKIFLASTSSISF